MNEVETLENWRALTETEEGVWSPALPLPGCIAEGDVDGLKMMFPNAYFDFSNFLVTISKDDGTDVTYKLGKVNASYIKMLNEFIEYSKMHEKDGKDGNEIGD